MPGTDQWVCLKVIKHSKDYFDQALDEIKLLQYINTHGDPDKKHCLRLIDFFYAKERLFLVTELLREVCAVVVSVEVVVVIIQCVLCL
jgi:serine/threonine protein kinase